MKFLIHNNPLYSKIIHKNKNQKGFSIFMMILVMITIIVAIGAWTFSGDIENGVTQSVADVQVQSIINDGLSLKSSFEQLVINGNHPANIVFLPYIQSSIIAPNILDPLNGSQVSTPSLNTLRKGVTYPDGMWVYHKSISIPQINSVNGSSNMGVLLGGIKDNICQRINLRLHGEETIPAQAGNTFNGSAFVMGSATPNNPNTQQSFGIASAGAGWSNGCVFASPGSSDQNIYFQVFQSKIL